MLAKTKMEKRMIILLVVVTIVNLIGNIYFAGFLNYYSSLFPSYGQFLTAMILWTTSWIIIEILVLATLIFMIRKE